MQKNIIIIIYNMDKSVPSQVAWARLLLQEIVHDNGETEYENSSGPVWWGPHDDKSTYLSITDCSGFMNALLKRSYSIPNSDFSDWFGSKRPLASTYYKSIDKQNGFRRISNVNNIKVGDIIAIRFPPGTSRSDDTGHVMLINAEPEKMTNSLESESNYNPRKPPIRNTSRNNISVNEWRVNVIDQTASPHGKYDTRYVNSDEQVSGLGSGYIKLYTDNNGKILGYSWSLNKKSKFIDRSVHPILIGRLDI
nr:hypothetical protein [Megavirus caiporensis]